MKKLGTVALIGALTLGSFAATELFTTPTKASAATETSDPFRDSWGFYNTHLLYEFGHPMNQYLNNQVIDGYHNGQQFKLQLAGTEHRPGTMEDKVKIFRHHEDGTLQRYITIDPKITFQPDGTPISTWTTNFNVVYPPGYYIAIAYINGYHFYSKEFIVNQ